MTLIIGNEGIKARQHTNTNNAHSKEVKSARHSKGSAFGSMFLLQAKGRCLTSDLIVFSFPFAIVSRRSCCSFWRERRVIFFDSFQTVCEEDLVLLAVSVSVIWLLCSWEPAREWGTKLQYKLTKKPNSFSSSNHCLFSLSLFCLCCCENHSHVLLSRSCAHICFSVCV